MNRGPLFYVVNIMAVVTVILCIAIGAYFMLCPTALADKPTWVRQVLGLLLFVYAGFRAYRVWVSFRKKT